MAGQRGGFLALVKPLALVDDTALLAVGNQYAKDFLEAPANASFLTNALAAVAGRDIKLAISVDPSLEHEEELPAQPEPLEIFDTNRPAATPPDNLEPDSSHLFRRYTFDNFVIGTSNRFAHAAAVAVAEAPAKAYNPLFIYGGSGLGKTHLLHAIGNYARSLAPHLRVRYTTSEEFTNEFINSVRDGRMADFRHRYRNNDLLLIDDIQFLKGRDQTMEEFFHTFNTLHNAGSQVVITSDLHPKQLDGFEDRLRSRFEWGLLTDVNPPDLETRIAILRKKAASEGLYAPDDVVEYIASRVASNIRELEGALIRVTAFANLNAQPVDLALAEIVLRDLITDSQTEITASLIIGQTANYFSVSIDEILGPSRTRTLVDARQIAMYLCRELTDLSLPAIGREFGGRDHTTVLHAEKKVKASMTEDRKYFYRVTELTNRVKQHAAR
ncbi:MAG: chromosomal replication initiator protein DnaA [Bifidobacteriaceae bacterium]|nr:chromosomal replication initiator protein DnaA [Bifidobacteriaceae bacterium]